MELLRCDKTPQSRAIYRPNNCVNVKGFPAIQGCTGCMGGMRDERWTFSAMPIKSASDTGVGSVSYHSYIRATWKPYLKYAKRIAASMAKYSALFRSTPDGRAGPDHENKIRTLHAHAVRN